MNYIAIATRQYGQGRITISSDHMTGYRSGHGKSSVSLWRKLLEWTGQRKTNETIKICVIATTKTNYSTKLYDLSPVVIEDISVQQLAIMETERLNSFDLMYWIGTPSVLDTTVQTKIKEFAEQGGGVLVEVPSTIGDINIIYEIDPVNVESIQRPNLNNAYWTQDGKLSYVYTPDAPLSFLTSIPITQFGSDWTILMSDIETKYSSVTPASSLTAKVPYSSEFTVSTGSYLKDGIIILEEGGDSSESSSETSSFSSVTFDSSTSSSSSSQIADWSICDSMVAKWNLNDFRDNSLVSDTSLNLYNMAFLKIGSNFVTSRSVSDEGQIGMSGDNVSLIHFNNSLLAETHENNYLNFNDGISDKEFAVSMWLKVETVEECVLLCKKDVWEIGIDGSNLLYFSRTDDSDGYLKTYLDTYVIPSEWIFLTVNAGELLTYFYVNMEEQTTSVLDSAYSGINTKTTKTIIGSDGTSFFTGYMDKVTITDRFYTNIEIQSLYNQGVGTDLCEGIFYYTSSSSSSDSSSESSSSSL